VTGQISSVGIKKMTAPFVLQFPDFPDLPIYLHTLQDTWISDFIRSGQTFEPHIVALLRSLIRPGDTVLDVGANIGYTALIASSCAGKTGIVHAVEPERNNLKLLRRNSALTSGAPIFVHACAAGADVRDADMSLSPDNLGDHRMEIEAEDREIVRVPVRRVDQLAGLKGSKIDVVKIDTQGSETSALRGMQGLLEANASARLILEFWPYGLERCASDVPALMSELSTRPRRFWLVEHVLACNEVSADDLIEIATNRMSPESQRHADIVCLSAEDEEGIHILEAISLDWQDTLMRLALPR
jgi:FkbM family methyltransferase